VERGDLASLYRPDALIEDFLRELGDTNPKILLFGSRGCGKSTELSRIEQAVGKQFLIVGLDVGKNQVQAEQLSPEELILLIALAVAQAATKVWGLDLREKLDAFDRVVEPLVDPAAGVKLQVLPLLRGLVLFGTTVLDPSGAASTTAKDLFDLTADAVGWDLDIGGLFRRTRDRTPGRDLLSMVNDLIRFVTAEGGRAPLVLVDELDKIDDAGHSLTLLTEHDLLVSLECPVVLCGPNKLLQDVRLRRLRDVYDEVATLYHVRCWDEHDPQQSDPDGVATLKEIVARRVERLGREHERVISPTAEGVLIDQSGGVVRDLVRLLQLSAQRALFDRTARIEVSHANWAVARLRRDYELGLSADRLKCLREAKRTKSLAGTERSYELLHENYILCYSNDHTWYYPHSILLGRVGHTP